MLNYSPHVGKTLADRYEVKELLGEGGVGQVFRVWDKNEECEKALKLIDVNKKQLPMESVMRFQAEAETLKKLDHPSIIKYYDFFNEESLYCLVMEYLDTPTLADYISSVGKVPIKNIIHLVKKMADALLYIHDQGFVHHDFKSSNILYFDSGENLEIKLLDFGFSQLIASPENRTGGTLAYMAPEQTGILQKMIDHRADLYSLGIVMYELITGKVPFESEDAAVLIHQHVATKPQKPTDLRPETPLMLEHLVLKLLNKDPDDRYKTTGGLMNDLEKGFRLFNEKGPLDFVFKLGEEDHWNTIPKSNPFIGHHITLKHCLQTFDLALVEKKGTFALIEGSDKIGKTSLLTCLYNTIQSEEGIFWFITLKREAYERPFKLVQTLFEYFDKEFLKHSKGEQDEIKEALLKNIGSKAGLLQELLPRFFSELGLDLSKRLTENSWSEKNYGEALQLLLEQIARTHKRIIVFIDDFTFVDENSLICLLTCVEGIKNKPIVFLASYKVSGFEPQKQHLIRHAPMDQNLVKVNITPLSENDYVEILKGLFSNQFIELPKLLDPLFLATQGNPGYLRELLQKLIDKGLLYHRQRYWETDLEKAIEFIKNYHVFRLTEDPLDAYNATQKAVLKRAAIFQRAFNVDALKELFKIEPLIRDVSDKCLLEIIDKAIAGNILSTYQHQYYSFIDHNLRGSLLNNISLETRQNLHYALALYLEKVFYPKNKETIYDISHHMSKSGNLPAALKYYEKAAKLTEDDSFSSKQSAIYYLLAVQTLDKISRKEVSSEEQFALRVKALQYSVTQNLQHENAWEEIENLERWVGEGKTSRMVYLQLKVQVCFLIGKKEATQNFASQLFKIATEPEDEKYLVPVYNLLGRMPNDQSYSERSAMLRTGIEMAIKHKMYHQAFISMSILSILMAYLGDFKQARKYLESICERLIKENIPEGEVRIARLMAMITLNTESGNFKEVVRDTQILKKSGTEMISLTVGFYNWRLALAYGYTGNLKKALKLFDQILLGQGSRNEYPQRLSILSARVELALHMNDPETALYYVDLAYEQAEFRPDHYVEAMISIQAGHANIRLGQLEEAKNCIQLIAKPLVDTLDSSYLNCHLQFALNKLYFRQTSDHQFIQKTEDCLQKMRKMGAMGYFELFGDDLKSWVSDSNSSSTPSSIYFQGNSELIQLMEINRRISATLKIDDVLVEVLGGAMKITGAEKGYLFTCIDDCLTLDCEKRLFPIVSRDSQGNDIPNENYTFSASIIHKVYEIKKGIVTRDAKREKKWSSKDSVQAFELTSILGVPIILNNEIKGILYLDNHLAKAVFSYKDKEIVEMFATQAAIAINNAQIYAREQTARHQTEKTLEIFSRFVPHQFTNRFAEGDIAKLSTGISQQDKLTVLFSDIRGFTDISEGMAPHELFEFLNAYLLEMAKPIKKNNGFIDKFIGDAIMALFDRSPIDAVNSAMEMFEALKYINVSMIKKGKPPIHIGLGINTGDVMIGVIGSEDRTDTTVLGDAVNLASRTESLTKYYGNSFLITDNTYKQIKEMDALLIRCIDIVKVKGKKDKTPIYEIYNFDNEDLRYRKRRYEKDFQEAFGLFQLGEWKNAEKLFLEYAEKVRGDAVAFRFIKRCQLFSKLPPDNWDGVFKFDRK